MCINVRLDVCFYKKERIFVLFFLSTSIHSTSNKYNPFIPFEYTYVVVYMCIYTTMLYFHIYSRNDKNHCIIIYITWYKIALYNISHWSTLMHFHCMWIADINNGWLVGWTNCCGGVDMLSNTYINIHANVFHYIKLL